MPANIPPVLKEGILAKAATTAAAAAPANNQPTNGVWAALATPLAIASPFLAVVKATICGIAAAIALIKLAPQLNQAAAPSLVILVTEPIIEAIAPKLCA